MSELILALGDANAILVDWGSAGDRDNGTLVNYEGPDLPVRAT